MSRNFIFDGGASKRFHTIDTHVKQCIGNHSFGVAWLCEMITGGEASKGLIMAALAHDLAEHIVGDIPSPAKRALDIGAMYDKFEEAHLQKAGIAHYWNNLSDDEKAVMKFADILEGMMFCIRERKLGNRNIEIVFGRFASYAAELLQKNRLHPHANNVARIVTEITNEWGVLTNDTTKSQPTAGRRNAL